MAAAVSGPQGDGHRRRIGGHRRQGALRLGQWPLRASAARHDLREAQVQGAEFGPRLVIQLRGLGRSPGLVGDQRGMQRVDATEPLAIEERAQSGQRGIGAAVALLRPGDQQRLQKLGEALARQRAEALLRRLPMAGAHLDLAQQKLRRLAVGQRAGKLHRLGAAGDQAGDERLLQQFRIIRPRGERAQELGGRRLRVRLAHGEAAGQELAVHAGWRVTTRLRGAARLGRGIGRARRLTTA